MKNNFLYLIVGLLVGGFLVFAGMNYFVQSNGVLENDNMAGDGMDETMDETMNGAMTGMMSGLQGKTGDEFDMAFVAEMIVHHQGAIDMANAALENAERSEIKEMALAIIEAQSREIEQMQEWLEAWSK